MDVTLHLNMRLLPFIRADVEDMIERQLQQFNIGHVSGSGSEFLENGEIKSCDFDITLDDEKYYDKLLEIVLAMSIAQGSKLLSKDKIDLVGNEEGLAIYLNGTSLPDEVYQTCDVNYLIDELSFAMKDFGEFTSYYEGPEETALYFYGLSFEKMRESILDIVSNYPLCEKCRIVQIA